MTPTRPEDIDHDTPIDRVLTLIALTEAEDREPQAMPGGDGKAAIRDRAHADGRREARDEFRQWLRSLIEPRPDDYPTFMVARSFRGIMLCWDGEMVTMLDDRDGNLDNLPSGVTTLSARMMVERLRYWSDEIAGLTDSPRLRPGAIPHLDVGPRPGVMGMAMGTPGDD